LRLLSTTDVGVGFRVLDVGCGCGELAAYLNSLGVPCTGIDESPLNIMEARRAVPACEFTCGTISNTVPGPQARFDLVVVRDASAFRTSLLSPASLAASLQLLSVVRPGGCLAFLARVAGTTQAADGHHFDCYARHVGCLPGTHELHELQDGPMLARSLRAVTTTQHSAGYALAVLHAPAQPITPEKWTEVSATAQKAARTPCCEWAVQGGESIRFRSRAA
jgi:SAM-dependent methyltransferase